MLRLIPPPLHRLFYRTAHRIRAAWLRLAGGTVHGCCILAHDSEGRVVLVRHSYGSGRWVFPSGGILKREDPERAARREFAEELGCTLREVIPLGIIEEPFHGATNVVHVFAGEIDGTPRVDGREIVEFGLFRRENLPLDVSRTVSGRLRLLDRREGNSG